MREPTQRRIVETHRRERLERARVRRLVALLGEGVYRRLRRQGVVKPRRPRRRGV